ncbi:MAG: tetratricopeptide repeat protein, partial [Thermoflexibacteraceae bacterium]
MTKWLLSLCMLGLSTGVFAQNWADLNKQGQELMKKSSFKEAATVYEKALTAADKQFGNKHDNYQQTLMNLGESYDGFKAYDKARNCYLQVVQLKKDLKKDNTVDYADVLNLVAKSYANSKDLLNAEVYFSECLTARKRIQKESHPDYVRTRFQLAKMYKDANRLDKAEIEYNAILQPAKDVLGAKNPEYAEILADIGDISFARKKYDKSIEQYEQYLAIAKGLGGKVTDKDLYPVYLNLGDAYRFAKNYDKAVVNYNESLRIAEGDVDDNQLLENYSTITRYFNEMDKEADAEKLLEKKRELIKKTKGNRSVEYIQNSIDLSQVYIRSKQLPKAKEKLEHALEAAKEMGKDKEPIYAMILDQLGKVAEKEGKRDEAEKFYIQALDQRKVSLKGKE